MSSTFDHIFQVSSLALNTDLSSSLKVAHNFAASFWRNFALYTVLQFHLCLDHTTQTSYWHIWAYTHVTKMILNTYNLVYHPALTQETVFNQNEMRKTGPIFNITLRQLIKGAHSNHWNHIICIVSRHKINWQNNQKCVYKRAISKMMGSECKKNTQLLCVDI